MENIYPFNPMKILYHFDSQSSCFAASGIETGLIPGPASLNIDITNKCNHRCIWCYVRKMREEKNMDMDKGTAEKILKQFRYGFDLNSVLFTGGGEPTLHPHFIRLLNLANDLGYKIGITTNGSNLHKFYDQLADLNLRYVRISIDAGTATTYSMLHGCHDADFGKLITDAKIFSEKKGKNCELGFAFLVVPENVNEISDAIDIADGAGFDYISFRPSVFGHKLTRLENLSAMESIENSMESNSIRIYPIKQRFKNTTDKYKCRSTPFVAVVTADARLNLCCQYRGQKEWQWGDLKEHSLADLWGNEEHRRLLEKALDADCPKCRMKPYNEIIQRALIDDEMHKGFL